ncbi:hypothetical protein [Rhodohalobacter sp. 8-1]|uniref:hypothetical protein n=1 Tax=Rhodohalobacter sp. 8-1 TaxID=3131972 RepID=UPI0030EF7261
MIKLIRKPDDPKAGEIESRFGDLILSYKTEISDEDDDDLPKIKDGDTIISGEDEIESWLQELEADLKWQRSLSGDGCYIDPESGKVC